MLAQEMHIQFGLGYQKLGANSRRKFYPQEIDVLLNRAVDQFILDAVKVETDDKGFERIQVDVDKVRPLIVRGHDIEPQFIGSVSRRYNEYRAALPGDYAYLIGDVWSTARACDATEEHDNSYSLFVIPMKQTDKGAPDYYTDVRLRINGSIYLVSLQTDIPGYAGYKSKKDEFAVYQLLREVFNQKKHNGDIDTESYDGVELYFEKYLDRSYPGSLILVGRGSISSASLIIDGTTIAGQKISKDYTYHDHSVTPYTVPTRLVKISVIDNVLNTPFMGPLKQSPITSLEQGFLRLYTHPSFIVNKGSLTYIRQPQKIDVTLHRNCELAPEFHQRIVDMAVEYAAGRTEQATLYQVQAQDNIRNA